MDEFQSRKSWLQRRGEELALVLLMWPVGGFVSMCFTLWMLYRGGWGRYLMMAYFVFMWFDGAPRMLQSRKVGFVRRASLWKLMASYFPITLEKTEDLDPDGRYILGYHPHGHCTLGAFCAFASEGCNFSQLFPGLDLTVITLPIQFLLPVYREWLLGMGAATASKHTVRNVLQRGSGSAVGIVLGGAREAIESRPGRNNLVLNIRKGFVKIGLREGVSLVPCFGFGETDVYDDLIDSPSLMGWVRRFQKTMLKWTTFVLPVFRGRLGFLPLRRPIHIVVGSPIQLPHIQDPTQADIDHWHQVYVDALVELYNTGKDTWLRHRTQSLQIIK